MPLGCGGREQRRQGQREKGRTRGAEPRRRQAWGFSFVLCRGGWGVELDGGEVAGYTKTR